MNLEKTAVLDTLKSGAMNSGGAERREFIALATLNHFGGNARTAERVMGWGRETVKTGLSELRTGIRCIDDFKSRGNIRLEDKNPTLKADICSIAERRTQADPTLKTDSIYTKITARKVAESLRTDKGYAPEDIPSHNTIGNMLNRLGYNLKRTQKTKPLKKIKEVDEIFENVNEANAEADADPRSLRLSLDSKAHLKLGEFSRNGKSRDLEAKKALDHDMQPKGKLIPFGILNVLSGLLTIIFGSSFETSDFIVDCLELWWEKNKQNYSDIRRLVINLDNGPQLASNRTQFIRRMVEFATKTGLEIRLVYYPPYHSKYNPIERCWGILEMHWNGQLLDSVDKAIGWAASMTWKGIQPVVHLSKTIYEKGVSVTKSELKPFLEKIVRSSTLPKWDVRIHASSG